MNRSSYQGIVVGWLLALTAGPLSHGQEDAELLFVRRIAPLMSEKCNACHGDTPDKLEGGLSLKSYAGLRAGGDSEETLLHPGEPERSPLYLAIARTDERWSAMPPKEADGLNQQQLDWFKQWIQAGAPWPDAQRARQLAEANRQRWSAEDGIRIKTSVGQTAAWSERTYRSDDVWAYQPLQPIDRLMQAGGEAALAKNLVDYFLELRMPGKLPLAPAADRRTWLRRATFDLLGLPPTPSEVDAFVNDPQNDDLACAKVIDRLLDSPHYGERMAQHWLDVTRYADSSGLANDFERGNAWRYRDYVIRSFNQDKGYDQFIREQIAGDEINADNPEMLIATGFLRMGPWELTGMEVAKVARQRFLDDVTNSVGETFLAQSLQCARCHDHKFDPIPTVDYYSLQAVFATTQLAERPAPFLPQENLQGFEEKRYLEMRRRDYLEQLAALDAKLLAGAQEWFRQQKQLATDNASADKVEQWLARWDLAVEQARKTSSEKNRKEYVDVFGAARNALLRQGVDQSQFPPKLVGFSPEDFGLERVARKGLERLRWELERYEPYALAVYSGRTPDVKSVVAPVRMPDNPQAGELETTCVLTGGDPFSPGQPVKPGVLSVLANLESGAALSDEVIRFPDAIDGRRLALADWIASPRNPLTVRAIVNRIWMWHFGQPLAGNPNNFGSTGKRPTHPELLDALAGHFIQQGWSIKALHRLIMASQAYRRSCNHPSPKQLSELDPQGTSYAAFLPRRLTAEELRDSMLATTGELNLALGGIPVRPEINLEAALQPRQVMGTFAAAWVPNPQPHQRHRRSIYALKLRGLPDPQQEIFNQPAPDFSCERREATSVTPQVLSLFNSQSSQARSLALAVKALRESQQADDVEEAAVQRCFLLVLGRPAENEELAQCLQHWQAIEQVIAPESDAPPQATSRAQGPPKTVRREAVEENTGERFSFDERLYAYEDFVPDVRASDVSVRVRALADVCLALFNCNEFVFVY